MFPYTFHVQVGKREHPPFGEQGGGDRRRSVRRFKNNFKKKINKKDSFLSCVCFNQRKKEKNGHRTNILHDQRTCSNRTVRFRQQACNFLLDQIWRKKTIESYLTVSEIVMGKNANTNSTPANTRLSILRIQQ